MVYFHAGKLYECMHVKELQKIKWNMFLELKQIVWNVVIWAFCTGYDRFWITQKLMFVYKSNK